MALLKNTLKTHLHDINAVKRRPGMYINTTSPDHLACELIDIAVDKAMTGGSGNRIDVILHEDNSIEVIDIGRGMPVEIDPEEGISGVELIMTKFDAGVGLSNRNHAFSGGLHGAGVMVITALSTFMEVKITQNGFVYFMRFENGSKVQDLEIVDIAPSEERGTTIRFYPEQSYFLDKHFSKKALQKTIKTKAAVCPGLVAFFCDKTIGGEEKWHFKNVSDYIEENLANVKTVFNIPFTHETKIDDVTVAWAVNWTDDGIEKLCEGYVNCRRVLYGTHVDGFLSGLLESINEFCCSKKLLSKGMSISMEDIEQNINFILSIKLPAEEICFTSASKRLLSQRAFVISERAVRNAFALWLEQHIKDGKQLVSSILLKQ
ncbi:MAG: ATP-binding protein [Desulfamplus sp.]